MTVKLSYLLIIGTLLGAAPLSNKSFATTAGTLSLTTSGCKPGNTNANLGVSALVGGEANAKGSAYLNGVYANALNTYLTLQYYSDGTAYVVDSAGYYFDDTNNNQISTTWLR